MGSRTPLYDKHVETGARMVDFGGWEMPLHYGSQKEEHHSVRNNAGIFDVSHMTIVDLRGDNVRDFLRHLLANDVAKLQEPGKALYAAMLNETGGVIDDLIVYFPLSTHRRPSGSMTIPLSEACPSHIIPSISVNSASLQQGQGSVALMHGMSGSPSRFFLL